MSKVNKEKMTDREKEIGRRAFVDTIFYGNGEYVNKKGEIKIKGINDIITSETYGNFFKKSVEEYLINTIQPQSVIVDNLFRSLEVKPGTEAVRIKMLGALEAQPIAELGGVDDKEQDVSYNGYEIHFDVTKWGLKVGITEKALKNDDWGIMKFWLQEAANALVRTKEHNAYKIINEFGTTVYDNSNPGNSAFGALSGRNIAGKQNGVCSFNDLVEAYSFLAMRGYNPDVMLVHPFAWRMFLINPEIREVFLKGTNIITAKVPTGGPFPGWDKLLRGFGYNTKAVENPFSNDLREMGATFRVQPVGFPAPLTIIVTPRVPFRRATVAAQDSTNFGTKGVTDIIIADSSRAGIIGITETPNVRNWADIAKLAQFWEISEEYGFGVLDQGKAVAVIRNTVVDREYSFQNVNSVSLTDINREDSFSIT